ncbi:MAG: Crp/Fnr family transcriptional regulator [Sporolactobacillus sp.]
MENVTDFQLQQIKRQEIMNTNMFAMQNIDALKKIMTCATFRKGAGIYWEGDRADKLFYLVKGRVKLYQSAYDGKDLVLHYFTPNDMFGELSCFGFDSYVFTAEALTECTIGIIAEKDVDALLTEKPDLALEFMRWLGLMSRYTQIKLRDLIFYGKNGALASTLLRMIHGYGKKEGDGIHFTIELTNTDLAQLIGSTRETVNRMLQQWKADGAISYYHGSIIIRDLDYIKAICHCEDRCPMNVCRL